MKKQQYRNQHQIPKDYVERDNNDKGDNYDDARWIFYAVFTIFIVAIITASLLKFNEG